MERTDTAAKRLETLSKQLEERGQVDLAQEVGAVINILRPRVVPEPPGGVMTTGEAASVLGVKSVNTIKRWVAEGLLAGFRRGGRVMVSRESVERMARSPEVADQRTRDAEIAADLEEFDAGDEPLPPTAWAGRKPWTKNARTRA
jgi:excisionase family DNA binding protein